MWEVKHIRQSRERTRLAACPTSGAADLVVMRTPALDDLACIIEAGEPVQIQAVLAELAIEAVDERILSRFARLHEVPLHLGALRQKHIALPVSSGPLSQTSVFGSRRRRAS